MLYIKTNSISLNLVLSKLFLKQHTMLLGSGAIFFVKFLFFIKYYRIFELHKFPCGGRKKYYEQDLETKDVVVQVFHFKIFCISVVNILKSLIIK